jgi:raffinose/stachyose/melibiose transport system substrate-binding protein
MSDMQGLAELEKRQERKSRFRNYLGLAILVAALGWSAVHVAILSFGPQSDTALVASKTVVRFAHWQLEGRCVDALNEACREYEKLHPGVSVEQIPIPERAYEQWVRTQLIGRTAPDLIEMRWGGDIISRYFVPMTDRVEQPNPYNADDPDLAGQPWRETYIDNMMGGWNDQLRDYYGMPLSVFTVRCYANRTLMKEAANVTQPPKNLGEFIGICQRIQAFAQEHGKSRKLLPIAGSEYTENIFRGRYWAMATWNLLEDYDENCDGWIGDNERLEAIYTGKLDLATNPCVRAGYRVLYDISRYFNSGFMGMKRDESVFSFAQSNAAMIATGTWDAGSLWRQVAGDFDIMVFDFPIPTPEQPYGQYIRHRITEAGDRAGFTFGLTRISRDKERAVDFMHFLTSRKVNEKLNEKFRWFPAIRGAKTDSILAPFRPQEEGAYGVFDVWLPGDTQLHFNQQYTQYISDVDPEPSDHEEFLRAAQGNPDAFRSRYRGLADKYLARLGGKAPGQIEYPYAKYIDDWRDNHYEEFIRTYAADYKKLALADYDRALVSGYYPIVESEGSLAHSRVQAMREGMSPTIRRNYVSQVMGEAGRIGERADARATVDRIRAYLKDQKAKAAGKGDGK